MKREGFGLVYLLALSHSKPCKLSLYAVKETLPGVKPTFTTIVLSNCQLELSLINLAWICASESVNKFLSSGHV